jgi:hypothetical protein
MDGFRRSEWGDVFCAVVAALAFAISLQGVPPAGALEYRSSSRLSTVLQAFRTTQDGPSSASSEYGSDDSPFCFVDLDIQGEGDFPALGFGRSWRRTNGVRSFAAVGTTLAGPDVARMYASCAPGRDAGLDPSGLHLGAWVGAGAYWTAAEGHNLGIGFGWVPTAVGIDGEGHNAGDFRAIASFGLSW